MAATTRKRRKGRRLIAAATLGAAVLTPGLFGAYGGALAVLPLAKVTDVQLPGPGNILALLQSTSNIGVNGSLPGVDSVSPELIAALRDPGQLPPPDPFNPGLTDVNGIPSTVLQAYQRAAMTLSVSKPGCHLHWSLLAGIGKIESNHGRIFGGKLDVNGNVVPRILGPQLSGGPGFAAIRDTDNGALDGDTTWDRAVGPMQFIPSTWRGYAADGNGDGKTDPNNAFDAALGAGNYLCSGGLDLAVPAQLAAAVFRYNHSNAYVTNVLTWMERYAKGVNPIQDDPLQPVDPGWAQPPPQGGNNPPPTNPTTPTTPPPGPTTTTTTTYVTPSQSSTPGSTTTITTSSRTTTTTTTVTCVTTTTSTTSTTTKTTTTTTVTTTPGTCATPTPNSSGPQQQPTVVKTDAVQPPK